MAQGDSSRSQTQRSEILETAARFVAQHGYHGMTMRALAKATGKSLAYAYNYFSSKEEILFALQREAFEALIAAANRSTEQAESASSRLYLFILNHLTYSAEHADIMRVLVHEAGSLPTARRRTIRALKQRYFEVGREIVEEVVTEGLERRGGVERGAGEPADPIETERLAYSLFGMLNWVYSWYESERHGDLPALARTMHRLLLSGAVDSGRAEALDPDVGRRFDRLGTPSLLHGTVSRSPSGKDRP